MVVGRVHVFEKRNEIRLEINNKIMTREKVTLKVCCLWGLSLNPFICKHEYIKIKVFL